MKVICLSDIHCGFSLFRPELLPEADLCLIAGDITNFGAKQKSRLEGASLWLAAIAAKYPEVFFIYGNHDLALGPRSLSPKANCLFVQDEVLLTKSVLRVAGANLSVCYNMPELERYWCNMTTSQEEEAAYYSGLPECDLLISHTPPSGVLGLSQEGAQCGSEELRKYIDRVQPKLVVCGHIHEAAGAEQIGRTLVVNTARRYTEVEI